MKLRSLYIINNRSVTCLIIGVLGFLIAIPCSAQSPPASRADPAQVKADVERILSSGEFRPRTTSGSESALTRLIKWFQDRWDELWKFIKGLFSGQVIGAGASVLQWVFIGLFLIAGAWLLSRLLRQLLLNRETRRAGKRTAFDLDETESERITEPDAWLEQAQRYAEAGDHRRAFRAVFLAILMRMDQAGIVQYNRARTNGDYLRALRGQNPRDLYDLFRPLVIEFDRRWYGSQETEADDYDRSREAYSGIQALIAARNSPRDSMAPTIPAAKKA